MTRKLRLSLLALAATATMATTALVPSTASAWGRVGGYHFGGLHTGFYHFNHYRFGWGFNHYRFGWGFNHYRFGWRYPGCYWGNYCHPYRWYGWYRWFPRRPIVYGAVGAVGGAAVASAPAMSSPAPQPTQQANCLVKQYLPNGAVAFADTCTNEQAVAMPNGGGMQPQGPSGPGAQ